MPFSGISCPLGGLWRRGWRRGLWGFIALLLAYFLPAPGKQVDLNGYICPLPGIDVLGENRVQEMTEKLSQNAYGGAPLHFIGHLQRNKVKQVVGKVALIQSVGSLPLLEAVEKEAEKQDIVQDILLEVNIGGEEAKSGFAPAQLEDAARAAQAMSHVRVRGLMTIPPADSDRDTNIRYFQEVRALYVDINEKLFHNELKCLSMGMSGDFEDAIRNGATMVRVGTAIFGARYYPT